MMGAHLVESSSWWLREQREGFSAVCVTHFGVDFGGCPTLVCRSHQITVTHPERARRTSPPKVWPHRTGHNGSNALMSKRMVQRGGNLIG